MNIEKIFIIKLFFYNLPVYPMLNGHLSQVDFFIVFIILPLIISRFRILTFSFRFVIIIVVKQIVLMEMNFFKRIRNSAYISCTHVTRRCISSSGCKLPGTIHQICLQSRHGWFATQPSTAGRKKEPNKNSFNQYI